MMIKSGAKLWLDRTRSRTLVSKHAVPDTHCLPETGQSSGAELRELASLLYLHPI